MFEGDLADTRAWRVTNIEFSNEYEYILDVNFGPNTNTFFCSVLVEYEY